ncbi:MAG: MFS transporter [Alphaproteobacteria bacterium]|nr:MFS transporter [Alphaproteobacteria bacterium]
MSSPGTALANGSLFAALTFSLASFIVSFDITAVVVAMPQIRSDLALSVSGFAWVMDAYSLAFVVMLLSAGALADRFGRRRALTWGNAIFAFSSVACGLATGEAMLYGARAIQGLGSAFVICGVLALMSERFPDPSERARAFALVGTVTGAAMAMGPAGGGLIAEYFGWRWVFLVNLPVCLAIAILVPRASVESLDPAGRRIDLPGVATLTLALTSLTWFLLHGTSVGHIELPLVVAAGLPAIALAAFVLTQRMQARAMFDLALFRERAFLGICIVPVALSLGYWALLVYLPLFLEVGLGQGLAAISWLMLVATLPMLLLPFLGAKLVQMLGARWFFGIGLAVVAGGCLTLALAAGLASLPVGLFGMLLCGAAAAVLNAQVSSYVMMFAPRERTGTVSAMATLLRQGGFALGIAILGAVLRGTAGPELQGASNAFAVPFLVAGASVAVAAIAVAVLTGREPGPGPDHAARAIVRPPGNSPAPGG